MAIIWDSKINKHTDWEGDLSTYGKPVSGRAVLEFIKESLLKRFGYLYEDKEKRKYLAFADEEDYLKFLQTADRNLIVQEWNIPKSGLGYVYEDFEQGRFLGFESQESYEEYLRTKNLNLILVQWNNSREQGIPIYTKSYAESLIGVDPETYIVIPDENDLDKKVENKTYDTSINGPLANILFSALRQLLSEVAKIKNSFTYGLYSYNGTNTAMSRQLAEYLDIEEEPLWAIDEDGLSLVSELTMDLNNSLSPLSNVNTSIEGVLQINSEGASWTDENMLDIKDSKIMLYLTLTNKNSVVNLFNESGSFLLNLNTIETQELDLYNILIVISRLTEVEGTLYGNNFIWISIGNPYTNNTIAEGYYNGNSLQKSPYYLSKRYLLSLISFTNTILSKCKIYSKYLDFSKNIVPSKPDDSDYKYRVAHITIRSVDSYSTLERISNLLPNNELVFVEDIKKLYIKNKYKLIAIGSSTQPIDEDDMTQEEVILILEDMGIVRTDNNELVLSDVGGITFIHQDSGTKFNLSVDSEGNIRTSKIIDETLLDRIHKVFGNESTGVGDDSRIRGFVGRLGLAELNEEVKGTSEAALSETSDLKLYSDRIKIGAFYAPAITNSVFGCSHCYVELENTSNKDFPLEGCYLHYARNIMGSPVVSHLALHGNLPAGGTFLIRGAKKADFESPNTFIKVKTFDQEWYEDGELIDFSHNGEVIVSGNSTSGNDPHGFALTYGNLNLEATTPLWSNNTNTNTSSKAPYVYSPTYIDAVYYNIPFFSGDSTYWVTSKSAMSYIKNEIFPDCIYKNTFELDPAKQAYQALNTYDSSRIRHANVADYQYLYLGKEFIEFPKTKERCAVSKFTPKASFEHKNVCTDKTSLDKEKPNMVTCSFGKNPYTTRCFNWISGGVFDEYVWIKVGDIWKKFESYKDNSLLSFESFPKRKEFSEDIINVIYKRLIGKFPAADDIYTSHKCIIDIVENSVESPITYTYIVGRADKNGNPDPEHSSEEYTFTLYPESYVPRIYQTSDQQGFHWVEYLSWAAAAETLNEQINEENNQIIPVLVNTGDMTQSGARINEWLDYYNAGKSLFKHLEQVNVVGNNDLCGNDFTILGTGDDAGKANSYYFHVFYCYEVETEEGMIPIINDKYIPSLYKIDFANYTLLMVNSEITETNCKGWFKTIASNGDVVNAYTGWTMPTSGNPIYDDSFTSIYTIIYNMTNNLNERNLIAVCHEMPFTVITNENLGDTVDLRGRWRSISGTSLVGSHLNLLGRNDTIGTHWFSRLLEYRKCKLCIGGHKHTYACTYPLMENYIYGELNSKDNGPMPMSNTLANDNLVSWIKEGNNLSKFPLTKRSSPGDTPIGIFYPSEFVDSFYNGNSGVIYFMCQATGFKLMSNKELPSNNLTFSQYIPKSNTATNKASAELRYPMYAIIELGNTWNIKLVRLKNIQTSPTTLFTQINHSTEDVVKLYLYNNSLTEDSWKYGGWSNTEQSLLEI